MDDTPPSLHDRITQCASTQFGITNLLPVQQLVIHNILETLYPNEDCDYYTRQIIVLPTGTGKSACFQIPAFLSEGVTLVVYPLISLIHDQQRRMKEAGLDVYTLIGGRSKIENDTLKKVIHSGAQCCILTNPESLEVESSLKLLQSAQISLIVIDEAHCISKWGKGFRASYLNLGAHIEALHPKVCLAFTATASDEILHDINKSLFLDKDTYLLRGHANRENISYSTLYCIDKDFALASLLQKNVNKDAAILGSHILPEGMYPVQTNFTAVEKPAIVFCSSRSQCSRLALYLRDSLGDQNIFFYHAGLHKEEKRRIERWFFESENGILIATCAYGMGVDKSNIRTVIHYNAPKDVENFLQESGRAGRDKEAARSIVLREFSVEAIKSDTQISCRRDFYLHTLGSESSSCTGCDCCLGEFPIISPEIPLILKTVQTLPHTFTTDELQRSIHACLRTHSPNFSYPQLYLIELTIKSLLKERILIKNIPWSQKLNTNKSKLNLILQ